jgi:hypothetical protein
MTARRDVAWPLGEGCDVGGGSNDGGGDGDEGVGIGIGVGVGVAWLGASATLARTTCQGWRWEPPHTHLTLVSGLVLRGGSLPAGPRMHLYPNEPHRLRRISTHIQYCIGGSRAAGPGPLRRSGLPTTGRRAGSTYPAALLLRSLVRSWCPFFFA